MMIKQITDFNEFKDIAKSMNNFFNSERNLREFKENKNSKYFLVTNGSDHYLFQLTEIDKSYRIGERDDLLGEKRVSFEIVDKILTQLNVSR